MRRSGLVLILWMAASSTALADEGSAVTKLRLAESEVGAGNWLRAEKHFREVIADPNAGDVRATARAELAALSPRVPRLRILVNPAAHRPQKIRVEIDGDVVSEHMMGASGTSVSQAGVAFRVDPGSHRVVATSELDERAAETVNAKEGETTSVTLELVAPPLDARRVALRSVGWSLFGTGAATGTVALVLLFVGGMQNSCYLFCDRARHEGDGLITAGWEVGLVSLAHFVTGGIFLNLSRRPRQDPVPDSQTLGGALPVPTWYNERPPVPNTPWVIPVFARTF